MTDTAPSAAQHADALEWVEADGGYTLALDGTKLLCKNAKGKQLASVPKKVRTTELAQQLLALRDWLAEHEQTCADEVEAWMLRSLPVPLPVIASVWDDPAWCKVLENAVVAVCDAAGTPDAERAGYLRGVDKKRGLGVVNLDGETDWWKTDNALLPHPILIEDLEDYRELCTELGLTQGTSQLYRETFAKPEDLDDGANQITRFSDGKFEMLMHAVGKARTLGYRVKGGFACCKVWEQGTVVEARFWIGAESSDSETYTGGLGWVDERERQLKLGDVGPVAFSEGMRMAGAIYAARAKDEDGEER